MFRSDFLTLKVLGIPEGRLCQKGYHFWRVDSRTLPFCNLLAVRENLLLSLSGILVFLNKISSLTAIDTTRSLSYICDYQDAIFQ
jgi:hypothetical protein